MAIVKPRPASCSPVRGCARARRTYEVAFPVRTAVTDGPLAEIKARVAGQWLWQADSINEAIAWVTRSPNPYKEASIITICLVFKAHHFGDALTPVRREQAERLRTEAKTHQAP